MTSCFHSLFDTTLFSALLIYVARLLPPFSGFRAHTRLRRDAAAFASPHHAPRVRMRLTASTKKGAVTMTTPEMSYLFNVAFLTRSDEI